MEDFLCELRAKYAATIANTVKDNLEMNVFLCPLNNWKTLSNLLKTNMYKFLELIQ
nr:hypothetical protein Iba_chr10eCG13060 [Ipomoea batatas]